jgi:hypothetical protein
MRPVFLALSIMLALVPAGPLAASTNSSASLVGYWLGKGEPEDPDIVSLLDFRADGTFVESFRKYDDKCKIVWQQTNSGTWSVSGNMQTLITQKAGNELIYLEDQYETELLTATQQHARHLRTGYVFMERRLAKFEFPDCFNGV